MLSTIGFLRWTLTLALAVSAEVHPIVSEGSLTPKLKRMVSLASGRKEPEKHWALLVASSEGYYNYRHQADVCHAYHLLLSHGLRADHIVLMMVDDIVQNQENPFPGKMFNRPSKYGKAVDVYEGCKPDYTGSEVSAETFLAVLTGNKSAVANKGTGRVLASAEDDHVFINLVDHGAPGLVAFPQGELYAEDLMDALRFMKENKRYKELVFYLEACESGSMFENILPSDMNIYVTTAANSSESSWATYCPPDDVVDGVSLDNCLGDQYSVNWMEDSDTSPLETETLEDQFELIKKKTDRSHVMQFGALQIAKEPVGDFQSVFEKEKRDTLRKRSYRQKKDKENDDDASFWTNCDHEAEELAERERKEYEKKDYESVELLKHRIKELEARLAAHEEASSASSSHISSVSSRDVPLVVKFYKYIRASHREQKRKFLSELSAEISQRQQLEELFLSIARKADNGRMTAVNQLPVTPTKFDCLRASNEAYKRHCDRYNDYSLQFVSVFVHLCEQGVQAPEIEGIVKEECTKMKANGNQSTRSDNEEEGGRDHQREGTRAKKDEATSAMRKKEEEDKRKTGPLSPLPGSHVLSID